MTYLTYQDDGLTEQVQWILKQAGQAGLMLKGKRTWYPLPPNPGSYPTGKAGKYHQSSKVPGWDGMICLCFAGGYVFFSFFTKWTATLRKFDH